MMSVMASRFKLRTEVTPASAAALEAENAELRRRLEEADETIRAIRDGSVDAFVVEGDNGSRIYTLEGAERPYRLLVERMHQGAATLAADGTIIYCNRRLAELLRVLPERLIGRPLVSFVSPDQQPEYLLLFQDGQSGASQGEIRMRPADDSALPAYITFNALDGGSGVGMLLTDLSAQKHQAELAASHELLKESNRVKDEFLATLSHELRTPLHAILGWAHLLRERNLPIDAQHRAIEVIRRNAKAQAQLVEDLLDVSRIVSNKFQLKSEVVDLGAVVVAAVETHLLSARSKGVRLNLNVPTDTDILVQGDGERLEQVVWNLLSNAIKFTPADGVVGIELRAREASAEIVVTDSGEGIRSDFLPLMFQRFRQADSTSARSHGGLGLGLAIVKHVTDAHGGSVSAESPGDGQGATFTVRLPIKELRIRVDSDHAQTDRPRAQLTAIRTLVVDDEADAREMMHVMLESLGAKVTSVSSADEALAMVQHHAFDAIVCDIAMPRRDGYSLIQAVRGLPAKSGGRVAAIAVTAYASPREREAAIQSGYDGHLAKPVDIDDLVESIFRALAASRLR
jgi:signal transduction histidine kinase/ActR/RegA family two-component response regulator